MFPVRRLASLCLLLSPGLASATVELSGFGSLVAGRSFHEGTVQFRNYPDDQVRFAPDSLAGLQVDSRLNDKATVTAQFVAEGNNDWNASLSWAYVRYQPSERLSWKMGRMNQPLFLFSDTIDVAYSYPWLTPPSEVYNVPAHTTDGVSVVYTPSLGPVDLQVEAYIGQARFTMHNNYLSDLPVETNKQFGTSIEASWEAWKLRVGYHGARMTIDAYTTPLWQALETLSENIRKEGNREVANQLLINDDLVKFEDLALMYDDGTWLGIFETKREDGAGKMPIPVEMGSYLTIGRHFGEFLPHITRITNYDHSSGIGKDLDASSKFKTITDLVNANTIGNSDGWMVGIRWDFAEKMAFKGEYQMMTDHSGLPPEYTGGGDYRLLRAGLDVVF